MQPKIHCYDSSYNYCAKATMPDSMSSIGRTNSLEYNLRSIITSFIAPTPAFNNYWN